jgi:hypothetical protein
MCLKLLFLPPFAPPSPSSLAGISSLHSSTSASYASSSVSPSLSSSSSFSSSSRCPSSLSYSPTSPSSAQFQPPPLLPLLIMGISKWATGPGIAPPLLLRGQRLVSGFSDRWDLRPHTGPERDLKTPNEQKTASGNEPRRWQSGFWARQESCAVSQLSNNYVTRPREFEACPGSDVYRQLFGRPSKSFPADLGRAGGTDLKSALAGAGFGPHAADRLMRMEQPQVPNCPSLRPGPVGTGFWSVRPRSPANSRAREGKAGKLCED